MKKIEALVKKAFKEIKRNCKLKMDICGNDECRDRREIISGLGGCLCKVENCKFVLGLIPEIEKRFEKRLGCRSCEKLKSSESLYFGLQERNNKSEEIINSMKNILKE